MHAFRLTHFAHMVCPGTVITVNGGDGAIIDTIPIPVPLGSVIGDIGTGPAPSGGGGGGGVSAKQWDAFSQRLQCGAQWAQNHSLAAAFGVQNTFVGRALGGNLFASATTTALALMSPRAPAPVTAYGGTLGGAVVRKSAFIGFANAVTGTNAQLTNLPVSSSGAVLAEGAEAATAEAVASAASIASGLAAAKFALDAVTFGIGYIRGCK